jgi:hypothetical protein
MRYGGVEWQYAEPIARALVELPEFKTCILKKTQFAVHAEEAKLLHEDMKALRSSSAETWWRSHYTEKCRCSGCSGQETDLLAVFSIGIARFELHVEIKRPGDKFPRNKDQARNYNLRAQCWAKKPPLAVLPHREAGTLLIFSETQRLEFMEHIEKFDGSLTFENINAYFPSDFAFPCV